LFFCLSLFLKKEVEEEEEEEEDDDDDKNEKKQKKSKIKCIPINMWRSLRAAGALYSLCTIISKQGPSFSFENTFFTSQYLNEIFVQFFQFFPYYIQFFHLDSLSPIKRKKEKTFI